jgi:hypothetical protein
MNKKIPEEFGEIMYEYVSKELNTLSMKLCVTGNIMLTAAIVCTIIEQFAEECGYDSTVIADMVSDAVKHKKED